MRVDIDGIQTDGDEMKPIDPRFAGMTGEQSAENTPHSFQARFLARQYGVWPELKPGKNGMVRPMPRHGILHFGPAKGPTTRGNPSK